MVYTSTSGDLGERCSVSLELPPRPGGDLPYTAAGDRDTASPDELVTIVRAHFEFTRTANIRFEHAEHDA